MSPKPGAASSSASAAELRQPGALRLLWRFVLRGGGQKPCEIKTVAVLRFHGGRAIGPLPSCEYKSGRFLV
jgi:hypothetical protein